MKENAAKVHNSDLQLLSWIKKNNIKFDLGGIIGRGSQNYKDECELINFTGTNNNNIRLLVRGHIYEKIYDKDTLKLKELKLINTRIFNVPLRYAEINILCG